MVAPSLLAVWDKTGGDTPSVQQAAETAVRHGAHWLHVDVMDGVYVPARTFGPEMVRALQGVGVLDVHLMVDRPEDVIQDYIAAGADRVVFHPSASADVGRALRCLADFNVVGGLALDTDEDVEWLTPWLTGSERHLLRQVLVMTVKAGAGGQSFRHDMLEKIQTVRNLVGPAVTVVVDGGVNAQTARLCAETGADCVVAGSAVFGAADVGAAIQALATAK